MHKKILGQSEFKVYTHTVQQVSHCKEITLTVLGVGSEDKSTT